MLALGEVRNPTTTSQPLRGFVRSEMWWRGIFVEPPPPGKKRPLSGPLFVYAILASAFFWMASISFGITSTKAANA